jgi:hypothetical protein
MCSLLLAAMGMHWDTVMHCNALWSVALPPACCIYMYTYMCVMCGSCAFSGWRSAPITPLDYKAHQRPAL